MNKKIIEGRVASNQKIAEGIFKMTIYSPEIARHCAAGQFVNLYTRGRHTLLPRPISLCKIGEEDITLVYGVVGQGTQEFSGYTQSQDIRISTPQGNGYDLGVSFIDQKSTFSIKGKGEVPVTEKSDFGTGRHVTLVGGGLGVPPLVALAEALIKQGNQVRVIAGFKTEPFLIEDLTALGVCLHVTTDNGEYGFKGTVMDYIRTYPFISDYYYACGPKAMLQKLAAYCKEIKVPVQVSMEERMGCGYGACLGCVCKTQGGYKKVCCDGPVFLGEDVDWHA